MISPRLATALQSISNLTDGYVIHPVVIRLAIDEVLAPVQVPVEITAGRQNRTCVVEGCQRASHANSLCHGHYKRHLRGTLTDAPLRTIPKRERIDRIEKKQRVKDAVIEVMGGKCMLCGSIYPNDVYDFHHVFDKELEITRILGRVSPENTALELSKCVLLCANCHRMEHLWLRSPV